MSLREITQVDTNVILIDFDIILGEIFNSKFGNGGSLIIVSPWIGDVKYHMGCCGFFSNFPLISGDYLALSELIDKILLNKNSDVKIITREPTLNKYENLYKNFAKNELNFLFNRAKNGAKIFSPQKGDLHFKMIIGTYGAVFGSYNLTDSGRYFNKEDGNFAPSTSKTYVDKIGRCNELIRDSKITSIDQLEKLKNKFCD